VLVQHHSFFTLEMDEGECFTHQPLYSSDTLNRRLGGFQTQSEGFGEEKPYCMCLELNSL